MIMAALQFGKLVLNPGLGDHQRAGETAHNWTLFHLEMHGRKLREQSLVFYMNMLSS